VSGPGNIFEDARVRLLKLMKRRVDAQLLTGLTGLNRMEFVMVADLKYSI